MGTFIKYIESKRIIIAQVVAGLCVLVLTIVTILPVFGAFNPGDTLDPNCLPSDPSCTVTFSAGASGSDGYIQFNDSGNLAATSSLFWDNTNSRLGIGTTTPLAKLHLISDLGTDPMFGDVLFQKENGFLLYLNEVYSSDLAAHSAQFIARRARGTIESPEAVQQGDQLGAFNFRGYAGTSFVQPAGVAAYVDGVVATGSVPTALIFRAGVSGTPERMRISSSGNVGIGTTTPLSKLSVHAATSTQLQLAYSANNYSTLGTQSDGALVVNSTANKVILGGANDDFESYLNLGLWNGTGTTTLFELLLYRDSGSAVPQISYKKARGTDAAPLALQQEDRIGAFVYRPYDGAEFSTTAAFLSIVDGPVSLGSVPTAITFETGDWISNRTERMRITSTGNVGIGTTTPGSLLTVAGTTTATCFSVDGGASCLNTSSGGTVTSVGLSVPTGLTVTNSPITTSGTIALGLDTGYVIPLSASTTNWNTFYNTPSERITAGTGLAWTGNTLNFIGSSTQWTTNGSDIYYNLGNVGIGTSTPASSTKLHVYSDYPSGMILERILSGGHSYITYKNPVSTMYAGLADSGGFGISSSPTFASAQFLVNQSGYTGIGTTTPFERLTVVGNAYITGTTTASCFTVDGVTCLSSGGGSGTVNSGTLGQVAFYDANGTAVSGTSTLFISNEKVSVGTTTTNHLFSVGDYFGVDMGGLVNIGYSPIQTYQDSFGSLIQMTGNPGYYFPRMLHGLVAPVDSIVENIGDQEAGYFAELPVNGGGWNGDTWTDLQGVELGTMIYSKNGDDYGSNGVYLNVYRKGNGEIRPLRMSFEDKNFNNFEGATITGFIVDPVGAMAIGNYATTSSLSVNRYATTTALSVLASSTVQTTAFAVETAPRASDLFTILSSGNVGVGTSTPDTLLTVAGDIRSSSLIGSGNRCLYATVTGVITATTTDCGSGGGSSQWTTTGSDIYYTTGNVGIGTVSPASKLQIDTNNNGLNFALSLRNTDNSQGGNAVGLSFINESGFTNPKAAIVHERLEGYGVGALRFMVNNEGNSNAVTLSDTKMSIMPSGRIGIGDTDPAYLLTVNGTVFATTTITRGSTNTFASIIAGDEGYNSTLYLSTPYTGNPANGLKTALISEGLGTYGRSNLHFALDNTGDSSTVDLSDSKMMITPSGNIGIGTTTPFTRLTVSGNSYFDGSATTSGLLSVLGVGTSTIENNLWVKGTLQTGTGSMFLDNDGLFSSNGNIGLFNNAASYINGNLGVGTTTPGSRFVLAQGANTASNGITIVPVQSEGGWTEQTDMGSITWGDFVYSNDIVSSGDGSVLAGIGGVGGPFYVYVSTDGGATWTERDPGGFVGYAAIAMSDDGTRIIVSEEGNGDIYYSTNSGATWSLAINTGSAFGIVSLAVSADGMKVVGVNAEGGSIVTSTDGGATWNIDNTYIGIVSFVAAASSADGSKLVIADEQFGSGGYIYTSTNSGVTWTEQVSSPSVIWRALASSADGTKLAGATASGYVYTSTDSGVTWTERTSLGTNGWSSIAMSDDGLTIVVTDASGYIYVSEDGGANWDQQTSAGSRTWRGADISADGATIVAVVQTGYAYTYAAGTPGTNRTLYVDANDMLRIGAGSDALAISATGNLGIGVENPGYKLSVNGTIQFANIATSSEIGIDGVMCLDSDNQLVKLTDTGTCTVSSERFKNTIETLTETSGLAFVNQLRPVSYKLNSTGQERVGFIAEEVYALDSRLAFTEADGITPRGVRYEEMTAVLAKAIQELDAKIASSTFDVGSSTSFTESVVNVIASLSEWVGQKITVALGIFDRIETQTASVANGIEMRNEEGILYCVRMVGDKLKPTEGSCADVAEEESIERRDDTDEIATTTEPIIDDTATSTDDVASSTEPSIEESTDIGTSTPEIVEEEETTLVEENQETNSEVTEPETIEENSVGEEETATEVVEEAPTQVEDSSDDVAPVTQ